MALMTRTAFNMFGQRIKNVLVTQAVMKEAGDQLFIENIPLYKNMAMGAFYSFQFFKIISIERIV